MDIKTRPAELTWDMLGVDFHAEVHGMHREDGLTAAQVEAELAAKDTNASQ